MDDPCHFKPVRHSFFYSFAQQAEGQKINPVFIEDFEDPDRSSYQQLKKRKQLSIAKGKGVNGGNALRASYKPFERGSKRITYRHRIPPALEYTFMFSTFHGGSTENWTPNDKDGNWITVHALFDNFTVYPGKHIRKAPGVK